MDNFVWGRPPSYSKSVGEWWGVGVGYPTANWFGKMRSRSRLREPSSIWYNHQVSIRMKQCRL